MHRTIGQIYCDFCRNIYIIIFDMSFKASLIFYMINLVKSLCFLQYRPSSRHVRSHYASPPMPDARTVGHSSVVYVTIPQ